MSNGSSAYRDIQSFVYAKERRIVQTNETKFEIDMHAVDVVGGANERTNHKI